MSVAMPEPGIPLPAIVSAVVGLAIGFVAGRVAARSWSLQVAIRDLALATALAAAASACIVAAGFVDVFGPWRLRTGLVSAMRNLDVPLVLPFAIGLHLALHKTGWLHARRPIGRAIALDAALTIALSALLGLAYPFWGDRRMAWALFTLIPIGSGLSWTCRLLGREHRATVAIGMAVVAFGWGWLFAAP